MDDHADEHGSVIPLGRVLCSLSAIRVLRHADVDPDDVVRRHRAGRLPGENVGNERVSKFAFHDRDGDVVELVITTRKPAGKEPETTVTLPWD